MPAPTDWNDHEYTRKLVRDAKSKLDLAEGMLERAASSSQDLDVVRAYLTLTHAREQYTLVRGI